MKIINYATMMILLATTIHAEVKLKIRHSGPQTTYLLSDKSGKEIDRKDAPPGGVGKLVITLLAPESGNYNLTIVNPHLTRTREIAVTDDKEIRVVFDHWRKKFQIDEGGQVTEL